MEEKISLEDAVAERLEWIDTYLAKINTPLSSRPFDAAKIFVDKFVISVSSDIPKDSKPAGSLEEFAPTEWFKHLHTIVWRWYKQRYGIALQQQQHRYKTACTLVLGTPFLMKVPISTVEEVVDGESFWLCFHDVVRNSKNPLDWLENGPNMDAVPEVAIRKAEKIANECASLTRSIYTSLMGIAVSDEHFEQLKSGIIPHVESAAQRLVETKQESLKMALWDMQMACEFALKALSQQRSSTFKESHDLFHLYDIILGDPPNFSRQLLSRLPNWEEMIQLRYGGGPKVSISSTFRSYSAMMQVTNGCVQSLDKNYNLGNFRLQLQKPSWIDLDQIHPKK